MQRYLNLARQIAQQIECGVYVTGERLPGVRRLSRQYGVSIATVLHAHSVLEDQGYLHARTRSGYYVSTPPPVSTLRPIDHPAELSKPAPVKPQPLWYEVLRSAHPRMLPLGTAVPHVECLPVHAVRKSLSAGARYDNVSAYYCFPPGHMALRKQIAKRMLQTGCTVSPDDIVITSGAQEAIRIALQTVVPRNGVVAVESPVFYGFLQVIESLGLKAIEIPTDTQNGISLEALHLAVEQWKVDACIVVGNCNNPLGFIMPDSHKKQLLQLSKRHGFYVIEDDVYGDLAFAQQRPRAIKSFDDHDRVIYCASFSKSIMPGLRIGWIIAGPHQEQVEQQKFLTNIASASLPQAGMAHYLGHGGHEKFLRQIRIHYARQIHLYARVLLDNLPPGSSVSQPQGGFLLWVQLPENFDALALYRAALKENMHTTPGCLFSMNGKFRSSLRLNCSMPWSKQIAKALQRLAALAAGCAQPSSLQHVHALREISTSNTPSRRSV